jgi:hypothetical protein
MKHIDTKSDTGNMQYTNIFILNTFINILAPEFHI